MKREDKFRTYTGEFITDAPYDSIKDIEYIKVDDLRWVIKQFKKSIAGHTKDGKDMLKGIEIIFQLRKTKVIRKGLKWN
jgi:hypothetical protein